MIDVETAIHRILGTVQPFDASLVSLAEADGLALAADVVSRVESPPFDKALMDGFAVQSADLATGSARLQVVGEIMAGQVASREVGRGEAIQIMTGAPLPAGADAVVKVEETRRDGDRVEIAADGIVSGTNLMRRAAVMKIGEQVLKTGTRLSPPQLAALAELGEIEVPVRRRPRVAVLATGDELVSVGETPGPGQIRNTNETLLTAQIRAAGGTPQPLGIVRDVLEDLAAAVQRGLEADVLVLTGGVSAGKLDLVPAALSAAGVREVFHKVEMKPGKPVWFGVLEMARDGRPRYVFGLPGNPVSTLVCFELFVRTAFRKLMGMSPPQPQPVDALLECEYRSRGDRPVYHPAVLRMTSEGYRARVVPWQGSSDLRATVEANAMIHIPAGERRYDPGAVVQVYSW